jgi:hypothetical protein
MQQVLLITPRVPAFSVGCLFSPKLLIISNDEALQCVPDEPQSEPNGLPAPLDLVRFKRVWGWQWVPYMGSAYSYIAVH